MSTNDTDWTIEEMAQEYIRPPRRVTRSAPTVRRAAVDPAFAESLRHQLRRERRERAGLEQRIAELERELATVRAEVGVERRMAELDQRMARVEAARTALRSVG